LRALTAAGSFPERAAAPSLEEAFCPAVSVQQVQAQHWAMPTASDVTACPLPAEAQEAASVTDVAVARPRQAAFPASHAPAAPRRAEVGAVVVVLDAPEVPRRAAEAASDAAAVLPQVGAAARDAEVAVGAAPHAAEEPPAGAAVRDAAEPQREEAAAVRAVAEPRQAEAPAVPVAAAPAVPLAAAWVSRRGRLHPAAVAAPRPAARSAHEMLRLQSASRSKRSSQAVQDVVWSWRSRFQESLL
jgi:hypothetical protein